jgi:hypothetical protein
VTFNPHQWFTVEYSDTLLDDHWNAVVAVAEATIESPWKPLDVDEEPEVRALFKRQKNLDRHTVAGILKEHGISAILQVKGDE